MEISFTTDQIINMCSLPLVGAFVGWVTNYLAIKMLFRPSKPWCLFGLTFQGVFPKRQKAFATKVGQVVSTELISGKDLKQALRESASADDILALVGNHIESLLTKRLPPLFPIVSAFINAPLINKVKALVIEEFKDGTSEITDKITARVEERIDIHAIVEEKVAGFSSEKLEEIVVSIMRRELRFVELCGGVLGFMIGLGQLLWFYWFPSLL